MVNLYNLHYWVFQSFSMWFHYVKRRSDSTIRRRSLIMNKKHRKGSTHRKVRSLPWRGTVKCSRLRIKRSVTAIKSKDVLNKDNNTRFCVRFQSNWGEIVICRPYRAKICIGAILNLKFGKLNERFYVEFHSNGSEIVSFEAKSVKNIYGRYI